MKKILYFVLIITLHATVKAQNTDENTLIINNYFQVANQTSAISMVNTQNKKDNSIIQVVQNGDKNNIYINALQTNDQQTVQQTGNHNNYEYYNYYSIENSNLKVNQEGNSNSLQVFGENSLMRNAEIHQKSDFQKIIVKNFTK